MRKILILCVIAVSAHGQARNPVSVERRPSMIEQLPLEVQQDLAKRQCMIPRYSADGAQDSAYVKGHFRSSDTVDYAVVCHIPDQKSQLVLVYSIFQGTWRGEAIEHGTFDPSPSADRCEMQISTARPAVIHSYAHAFAPEEIKRLPALDHDGVEINLCDKASTVHYFSKGKWLLLQGAD